MFKTVLNQMAEKYIPTKLYRPKDGHLWVKNSIKRLMRKRDKPYAKLKSNRSNKII